jgi:hypothetical protein
MKEEIQLSQDRRDGIINFLLEWLTGPDIDSRTLGHFRFIGEMFGILRNVRLAGSSHAGCRPQHQGLTKV